MSRRWAQGLGLLALAASLSGCAALLLGAGAAGGYAVSADSITNRLEAPYDMAYDTSQQVVDDLGVILEEDHSRGRIKAEVEGAIVTVTVKRLTSDAVELRVRARNKFLMPRMAVAQRVYNAIMEKL